jgi:hypothetical protein
MNPTYRIEEVTHENLDEVGLYCSRSKYKEDGYRNKLEWIRERFKDGLEYMFSMWMRAGRIWHTVA